MGTCSAIGDLGILLVKGGASPRDFTSSPERYGFVFEDLKSRRGYIGTRGIDGTRAQLSNRVVLESYEVGGNIYFQPGPSDLDAWMQRALGGTKATNTIDPTETLPEFDILVYRDNGTFRYTNCQVDKAIFRASAGPNAGEAEILDMIIAIKCKSEVTPDDPAPTSWPGTIPAVPSGGNIIPYTFRMGVLTLGGTAYPMDSFQLLIDNNLQVRNRNSLTPTCIYPLSRRVILSCTLPFLTSTHTLSDTLYESGAAGSLKFTSGNRSCDFQFADLRNIYETPTIPGKNEIPLSLSMTAYQSGSTPDIRIVNDITP